MPSRNKASVEAPAPRGRAGAEGAKGEAPSPEYWVDHRTWQYGWHNIYEVMVKIKNGYEVKEILKKLGYRWDGDSKVWYKVVNIKNLPSELKKLEEIGVKPSEYMEEITWIIHTTMRATLRRLAKGADFMLKEVSCCHFVLEPSLLFRKKLETINQKKPWIQRSIRNTVPRLLEKIGNFATAELDQETLKITVTYPNIPSANTAGQ